MTKIKLCGITTESDIALVNQLQPEYVGFVFAKKSKRYIQEDLAKGLKEKLNSHIQAVGVFVDEPVENVVRLLNDNVIDVAQLHGREDERYIRSLRKETTKPIIKAFVIKDIGDMTEAGECSADFVLLDAGAGSGEKFDWDLIKSMNRPFFLAGGLHPGNVKEAINQVHPYAVDVSSGIETNGKKDRIKMADFVSAVRKEEDYD